MPWRVRRVLLGHGQVLQRGREGLPVFVGSAACGDDGLDHVQAGQLLPLRAEWMVEAAKRRPHWCSMTR